MLEHNKRRLLILLGVIGLALFFWGIRTVFEGLAALVGQAPGLVVTLLFYAFAMIVQFGALMWFLSRPRTYTVTPDSPQIGLSFENYRGQPDLLDHAKSLVRILQGVQAFQQRGGEMPKGMLLAGAPGTGKTFLAGVMAAEAKLPFIYIDASSLTSMWFGMDALIVVSLFRKARGLARKYASPGTPGACIMFLDELDSIGLSRGGVQGGQQQGMMGPMGMMGGRGFALNTMLNQMDSLGQHVEDRMKYKLLRWLGIVRGPVAPKPVVFVIGATNRPDVLDPALVRPGRLDRRLNVYEPDGEGRRDILQHYLKMKAHDPDVERALRDVNVMTKEFGVGPTAGINTGKDYGEFIEYVDALHAKGIHVTLGGDYHNNNVPTMEYNLATYFLINNGGDFVSGTNQVPGNFWAGFEVDLGEALGPSERSVTGLWSRRFVGGRVYTVEPGAPVETIALRRSD